MRAHWLMVVPFILTCATPAARAEGLGGKVGAQLGEIGQDLGQRMRKVIDSDRPLKQREANGALRETLRLSVDRAAGQLSQEGAFSNDPERRIGLPEPLAGFNGDWNAAGRSGALTRLEERMNVAAEASAGMARAPMLDAASEIDFYDAVAIVRSGDAAASQFYALRAREKLEQRLSPQVEAQLDHAGAFEALQEAVVAGGAEDKLDSYRRKVIARTLGGTVDALLDAMQAEERAIRADPDAYNSPLLSDVFAGSSGG